MVKYLWRKADKRGVSLMIGYVLLIVIAIGLSVAVFVYLKLYLPKDEPKCYDDVSLSIDEVACENGAITLVLTNRGLFNVDGAFIRIGAYGRVYKQLLNDDESHFLFIGAGGDSLLNPGESWEGGPFAYGGNGTQELEVEPFLFLGERPSLCEKAVVARIVEC